MTLRAASVAALLLLAGCDGCREPAVAPDCTTRTCSPVTFEAGAVVRQGDGGLTGLDGLSSALGFTAGRAVYAVAHGSGQVVHVDVREEGLKVAGSRPVPGARSLAVSGNGQRIYVLGDRGVSALTPAGRVETLLDRGQAIATTAGRLAVVHDDTLELFDDAAKLRSLTQIADPALTSVRSLRFSPDGKHLYAAAFDAGRILGWQLDGDALRPLPGAALKSVNDVLLDGDGRYLFATSFCEHRVAMFERSAESGALTLVHQTPAAAPPSGDRGARFEEDFRVLPLTHPAALAIDGRDRLWVAALAGTFNLRAYRYDKGELADAGRLEGQPEWLDYSRFDFAGDEEEAPGPPLPPDPRAARGWVTLSEAGGGVVATNYLADALTVILDPDRSWFLHKGKGGVMQLAGAYNLSLSPDERHVYVAPRASTSIALGAFDVSGERPEWRPMAAIPAPEAGMGAVLDTAVAPTAPSQVFMVEGDTSSLFALNRDPATGAASTGQRIELPGCGDAPAFPVHVLASGDGRDLYIADFQWGDKGCLHQLRRDAEGTVSVAATTSHVRLAGIERSALSADGEHLYTASHIAGTVTHFRRDASTGALTLEASAEHAALKGAEHIALSADGRRLYASSPVTHSLVVFELEPGSGAFRFVEAFTGSGEQQLRGAAGIAPAPDGCTLYVAAREGNSVTALRHGAGGKLEVAGVHVDAENLKWVNGLVLTRNGKRLFAASVRSNSLAELRVSGGCAP